MHRAFVNVALIAQTLLTPAHAHVSGDYITYDDSTTHQITWGHNCDAIPYDGDVLVWQIDGLTGQVAMAPIVDGSDVVTVVPTGDDTVESQMCSALLSDANTPQEVAQ